MRNSLLPLTRTLFFSFLCTLCSFVHAKNLYVSPSGNDSNSGTALGSPFRTIQKAADVAVAGDVVLIRAGTYRETVRPAHSGTAGNVITYMPYNNEDVIIKGVDVVSGWTQHSGTIYKKTIGTNFYQTEVNGAIDVWVNEQKLIPARWPNTSLDLSSPTKSTLTNFVSKSRSNSLTTGVVEDNALPSQSNNYYVGAKIYMQPSDIGWGWTFTGEITASSGNQLTLQTRSDNGFRMWRGPHQGDSIYPAGSKYYLFDKLELLDSNGEFFFDENTGVLYLQTPDGTNPSGHTVEVKKRDFIFNLDSRSYITIRGLKTFGGRITTDRLATTDGVAWIGSASQKNWADTQHVAASSNITLEQLTVLYPDSFTSIDGHFYYQRGQGSGVVLSGENHVIKDSTIQYAAANGVTVMGRNNLVTNNFILDTNYMSIGGAGISTGGDPISEDHEISYNTIRYSGRNGITLRQFTNTDSQNVKGRVHHNEISHVMLQDGDGGAIYAVTTDGGFYRIDHNYFHNIYGYLVGGVYLDFVKNVVIDHNLIVDVERPIYLQGSFDYGNANTTNNVLIYNNTLIAQKGQDEFPTHVFAGASSTHKGVVVQDNIASVRLPKHSRFTFYDQLAYPEIPYSDATITNNLEWDPSGSANNDPKWITQGGTDYYLDSGSPAIDSGVAFQQMTIDGHVVPPYNNTISGSAPDRGAFERGETPWEAGATIVASLPLGKPRQLVFSTVTVTSITIDWLDNATEEDGYYVERKLSSESTFSVIGTLGSGASSFTDNTVMQATEYDYRVVAFKNNGSTGEYSDVLKVLSGGSFVTPDPVTMTVPADTQTSKTVTLSNFATNAQTMTFSIAPLDANDYVYYESDTPAGVGFTYTSIASSGTQMTFANTHSAKDYTDPIDIGFSFPFMGNDYSQLVAFGTGMLIFDVAEASTIATSYYPFGQFPDERLKSTIFFHERSIIRPENRAKWYYEQRDADTFVIQVDGHFYPSASANYPDASYQIVLKRDGTFYIHCYQFDYYHWTFGWSLGYDVGVQSQDGRVAFDLWTSGDHYWDAGKTVRFDPPPDWLALSTSSINLSPSNSDDIQLNIDTTGMADGNYTMVIPVISSLSYQPPFDLTVNLTVGPVTGQTYSTWLPAYSGSMGSNTAEIDDADGDGIANLVEYALNLNPSQAARTAAGSSTDGLPTIRKDGNDLVLTYRKHTDRSDLSYTVEQSTDMTNWSAAGLSDTLSGTDGTAEIREGRVTMPANGTIFLRLKITK